MNIEELVAGLKEQGLGDEEIRAELEQIKAGIDEFLGVGKEANPLEPQAVEAEDAKLKSVFGVQKEGIIYG